tara:strand:+ start:242 stop:508 length:267 start_codon:yes stop_codon:yes gene_type:complete
MPIRVKVGSSAGYKIRIGQVQATKLVSSSSASVGNLSSINDINTVNRSSTHTILMWNHSTQKYEHVTPFHVVDMSDATADSAMDAGTF